MTERIALLSSPIISTAFAATRSASVESSPPEMPITNDLQPVCRRRFFKPSAWIVRISSHLRARSPQSSGTKGSGANARVRAVSPTSKWKGIFSYAGFSAHWYVVMRLRSLRRRWMSSSL